jgi:hypothetical protein
MTTPTVDPVTVTAVVTVANTVCGLLRAWLGQRAQARYDAEATRRLELLITRTLEAACHRHAPGVRRHDPESVTTDGPAVRPISRRAGRGGHAPRPPEGR